MLLTSYCSADGVDDNFDRAIDDDFDYIDDVLLANVDDFGARKALLLHIRRLAMCANDEPDDEPYVEQHTGRYVTYLLYYFTF